MASLTVGLAVVTMGLLKSGLQGASGGECVRNFEDRHLPGQATAIPPVRTHGGDRFTAACVVDLDRKCVLPSTAAGRQLEGKGSESAFVFSEQFAIEPGHDAVIGCAEMNEAALAGPVFELESSLIPERALVEQSEMFWIMWPVYRAGLGNCGG